MTDFIDKNPNLEGSPSAPLVAILLCTFNGARFLAEQLDSLESQIYQNWSVIASDDGSTDQTLEILQQYKAKWASKFLYDSNIAQLPGFIELGAPIKFANGDIFRILQIDSGAGNTTIFTLDSGELNPDLHGYPNEFEFLNTKKDLHTIALTIA